MKSVELHLKVHLSPFMTAIGVSMVGWLVKLVSRRVVSQEVLAGTEIPGGGERKERLYLTLHCHHQNDSCIKTGSDESHFHVS